MNFNTGETWSRATALIGANFQLLAIIAGVFILLPNALVYQANPMFDAVGASTGDFEDIMEQIAASSAGTTIVWSILATLAQMIGYIAMIVLMGRAGSTVAEAIKDGVKSLPTIIAIFIIAYLALIVGAFILIVPFAAIGGLGAALGGGGAGSAIGLGLLVFLGVIVFLVAMVYLYGRFSLVLTAIGLDGQYNPFKAFGTSWRLTKPNHWAICGFWALLTVAYIIISLLIFGVLGLFAALFGSGSTLVMGLMTGVVGALVAMIVSGILVSMHQQLSGTDAKISETFE